MNRVWLLFDNGNYYSVNCSIYKSNPGSPIPADAFIVSERDGDFTIAARNAAHATYNALKERGEKISPANAGFELLERTNAGANIVGESGGLSLAISFASALLKLETPSIAATGIITPNGTIEKVKGLEEKLKTAAGLVNENGIVFFPEQNNYIIPDSLSSILNKNRITCYPVEHIDDVFAILLSNFQKKGLPRDLPPSYGTRLNRIAIIILFLVLTGIFVFWGFQQYIWKNKQEQPTPLLEKIVPEPLPDKKDEPSAPSVPNMPPLKVDDHGFD
ncbi:MAG: hypothetical protein GY699_02800 [Desulfobacteraceae bacterium]|nr:hypothetical protein [Desulfobacteraceae bacterium]